MKIQKWVTFEQEVDVEVSAEDIGAIFAETPDCEGVVLTLISRFHAMMKVTKDETLAKINNPHRVIIKNFLLELAGRFEALPDGDKKCTL